MSRHLIRPIIRIVQSFPLCRRDGIAATGVGQASKVFDADGDQLGIGSVSKRFGAVEGHELVHLVLAQDLVVQHVVAYLLPDRKWEK